MAENVHGLGEAPGAPPSESDSTSDSMGARSPIGVWLSADFRAAHPIPPARLLGVIFRLSPERWLRRIPGRETFPWPGAGAEIVKRITGGERRDYWHDRLRGVKRSAARREVENQRQLASDGIRVPRPLAWLEEASARGHPRRGGRSALVMERVPFSETLGERLAVASAPERARLLLALVRWVGVFHTAGWIHRDLYLQHIVLVGAREEFVLLDVARARKRLRSLRSAGGRRAQRTRWLIKDLAALQFSAPGNVSRSERLRFLARWLDERGGARTVGGRRAERRRFATRILKRARRMASHRPLHLDPADAADVEFLDRDS